MADDKVDTDSLLAELVAIKRLIVLLLLKQGYKQREIAAALDVDQSTVSKMFPKGIPKVPE